MEHVDAEDLQHHKPTNEEYQDQTPLDDQSEMEAPSPYEMQQHQRNQTFDKTEERDDKLADFSTHIPVIDSARAISGRNKDTSSYRDNSDGRDFGPDGNLQKR